MAVSTIAFVDTSAQSAAVPYYHVFPNEPIPGSGGDTVMVSKTIPLKNRSVENLLEEILKNVKEGGNALIVSHGNDTGLFFSFGDPKQRVQMETDVLFAIRYDLEGKRKEEDTAQTLKMSVPAWRKLKALIQKLQKLGLNRVDLRSCKVGKVDVALSAQQVFFGCNVACAPTIYDAFGVADFGKPTQDQATWQKWTKEHPGFIMTGAAPPDRCAIAVQYTPGFKVFGMADSADAMANWVKVHLPPGSYKKGDPVLFHGLTELTQVPVFAGDPDFRKNLAEAYKGKEPSRTIDLRTAPAVPR